MIPFRDWSLITGRGGATKREGGAREVLPLQKGGADAEGGTQQVLGSFLSGRLKF